MHIGTGFRTEENLANMVGGSCLKSRAKGEHKLRLEIYVCTEDEIENGTCDSCKTTACYYKGIYILKAASSFFNW